MNIALPSIWFHRGQTQITRTLRRALEEGGHGVYVHARMGNVYGQDKQERGQGWGGDKVKFWPTYDLKQSLSAFLEALKQQKIDLVLFNEEYDWELVQAVKGAGYKVATYLDYLHKNWLGEQSPLKLYDLIFCSTHRSQDALPPGCASHYMGWGIPQDTVVEYPWEQRPYLFFLNAGWLGLNDRKGLGVLLNCFQQAKKENPGLHGSLLVHVQMDVDIAKRQDLFEGVDVMTGSMRLPGLYHMAKVYCYPAILDGLGLSMLEAMMHGLAIICPDAPPWNEFVESGVSALLLPIDIERQRDDGILFPETLVSTNELVGAIDFMFRNPLLVDEIGQRSKECASLQLDWETFKDRLQEGLEVL